MIKNKKGVLPLGAVALVVFGILFLTLFFWIFILVFPCFDIPLIETKFCPRDAPEFRLINVFLWGALWFFVQFIILGFYFMIFKTLFDARETIKSISLSVSDLLALVTGRKRAKSGAKRNSFKGFERN